MKDIFSLIIDLKGNIYNFLSSYLINSKLTSLMHYGCFSNITLNI